MCRKEDTVGGRSLICAYLREKKKAKEARLGVDNRRALGQKKKGIRGKPTVGAYELCTHNKNSILGEKGYL